MSEKKQPVKHTRTTAAKNAGERVIEVDTDASVVAEKPTTKSIEELKREVYIQNRNLLLICGGILLLAVAIFFAASHIAAWIQPPAPQQWTYENAVLDVLAGHENENQYVYNGIIFARASNNSDSIWSFQGTVRGTLFQVAMHYGPKQVEDLISPDLAFAQIYSKDLVVLTLNTDLDNVPTAAASGAIAAIELGKVLGTKNGILNKTVIPTLTNVTAVSNASIAITCANASRRLGVIQIELSTDGKTEIVPLPNCVYIRGSSPSEIIRAADRFVYSLLGVIPLDGVKQTIANQTTANSTTTDVRVVSNNLTNETVAN